MVNGRFWWHFSGLETRVLIINYITFRNSLVDELSSHTYHCVHMNIHICGVTRHWLTCLGITICGFISSFLFSSIFSCLKIIPNVVIQKAAVKHKIGGLWVSVECCRRRFLLIKTKKYSSLKKLIQSLRVRFK